MKFKYSFAIAITLTLLAFAVNALYFTTSSEASAPTVPVLILNSEEFQDPQLNTLSEQLLNRLKVQPFNLIAFLIFAFAIIHTFFANTISRMAIKKRMDISREMEMNEHEKGAAFHNRYSVETFKVEMLRFNGEIEVIFGIWVIPLICIMTYMYDWNTSVEYLSSRNYTEPAFVIIMMALTATAPIVKFAENRMEIIAKMLGDTVSAWWLTIMIIGTLLGSFITEPAAMTLSALLLDRHFYRFRPTSALAYATLGLLFTNVSVGGSLTNFSAPPILLVARQWHWDTLFVFQNFGLKALLGIMIATFSYFFLFKKEFKSLQAKKEDASLDKSMGEQDVPIPLWISCVNLTFLIWIAFTSHHPAIFIGSFALFVGFHAATQLYQKNLELRAPLLVGFFLAGLVVHGSLQGWWIAPLLTRIHEDLLILLSITLTAFNDNASITYLASLIPHSSDALKYSVMAGAITGGGLTVIANAPNPAGQALLGKHFNKGIEPLKLFFAAFFPTIVMLLCFYLLE